jgi:hypothetical protein
MGGFREIDDYNFDVDPLTGVRQRLKIDSDGVMHWETTQDVSAIADFAHEARGNYCKNQSWGDGAHVASLPVLVIYDLIKRGIYHDKTRFRKWLNSVECAPYRTRQGNV